jgi:hypothetical protein
MAINIDDIRRFWKECDNVRLSFGLKLSEIIDTHKDGSNDQHEFNSSQEITCVALPYE